MLNAQDQIAHDNLLGMLAGMIWRSWLHWPFHAHTFLAGLHGGLIEFSASSAFSVHGDLRKYG